MPLFPRVLLALGLPLVAAVAQAQVAWEVPEGATCPSEADVRARAESLLAGSAAEQALAPMRAQVRALEDGTFELSLTSEAGARRILGESCDVVADAAALIYAMAIDPDVLARLAAEEELAAGPPQAASIEQVGLGSRLEGPRPRNSSIRGPLIASMVSEGVTAREDERRAREDERAASEGHEGTGRSPEAIAVPEPALGDAGRPTWVLGAGAVGDAGLLPGISVGPSAHAGLELDALRIDVRAMFAPAREARLENHETARGEVSFVGGEARACAVAMRAAIELAPCAGLTAGAIQAEGRGVSSPGSSSAPFFALSAGGTAAVPIADWLALRADLAAVVPITRPEFVIEGIDGVVHRPSVVGARLAIAAEVQLR